MKLAKANNEEVEALINLARVLNSTEDGFPCKPDGTWEDGEDMEHFDPDDPEHLRKFYDRVTGCFADHPGGINRTVWGYKLAMDNNVFDPDDDCYAWHPSLAAAAAARDQQEILEISRRLHTQDNRATEDPLFLVQIRVAEEGIDPLYSDGEMWFLSGGDHDVSYDEPPEGIDPEDSDTWEGWEKTGYRLRWETVMAAFTEGGAQAYIDAQEHNLRHQAHRGEIRIYAESFYRCAEMLHLRKFLLGLTHAPAPVAAQPATEA